METTCLRFWPRAGQSPLTFSSLTFSSLFVSSAESPMRLASLGRAGRDFSLSVPLSRPLSDTHTHTHTHTPLIAPSLMFPLHRNQVWKIPVRALRRGPNELVLDYLRGSTTHYWLHTIRLFSDSSTEGGHVHDVGWKERERKVYWQSNRWLKIGEYNASSGDISTTWGEEHDEWLGKDTRRDESPLITNNQVIKAEVLCVREGPSRAEILTQWDNPKQHMVGSTSDYMGKKKKKRCYYTQEKYPSRTSSNGWQMVRRT